MAGREDLPAQSRAVRPRQLTRRGLLAASGVAVAGCSSLDRSDGAGYDRSDVDLTVGYTTASGDDDAHDDDIAVSLEWRWSGENGGTEPDDAAVLTWDAERWELVGAGELLRPENARADGYESTGETVRLDGTGTFDGTESVRFRHDDTAVEADYPYNASCRLSPRGHSPSESNWAVTGRFAHVTGENENTEGDGWFGGLDVAWTKSLEFEEPSDDGQ